MSFPLSGGLLCLTAEYWLNYSGVLAKGYADALILDIHVLQYY